MEALTRLTSAAFSRNYRGGEREGGFLFPRHSSLEFSHSISPHHNRIHRIFVSSLSSSSETQKHLQNQETQIQDSSKTVHVKFQLQKECAYGEQFHIVGDDPMVGSWDPSRSIPLDWSDGNIWTLELDVPIRKSIQFKFILKGSTGNILWQPGPDRILQTRETKNTILVSEDWDNPELQMLIEEEPNSKGKAGSTSYNSETLVVTENLSLVAENLSQPRGRLEADIDGESASNDTITNTAWNPLPEKSANTIAGGSSKTCAEEEPFSVSSMDIAMGENALGNNGKTVNLGSSMDSKDEVNVVSYEGDPVLVPGLTPLTSLDFEETSPSEVGIADEHPVPELDSKKEPNNDSSRPEDSTKPMSNSEKELYDIDQVEKLHLPREQDLPNSKQSKSALKNDIQWGRKTLRKLLTSFGLVSAPKQLE